MVLSVKTTAFTSIFTLPPLNPDRERKLRLMSQLYDQGITTRQISDRHLAKVLQRGAASWLNWEAYTYRVCRAGRMTYHQYAHLRSGLVLGVRSPQSKFRVEPPRFCAFLVLLLSTQKAFCFQVHLNFS